MADFTGTINNIAVSYATGKPLLTFEVEGDKETAFQVFEELKDEQRLTIKVGKYRKKRSLDANAYAWVLLDQIAEKLCLPKTVVYRQMIKEIGGNSDIVCVRNKAVDQLRAGWERNGIGWCTEIMPSKIEGCTNVVLYYGSSTYDTAQMSRLIDNIVEECKAHGIETRSQEELESMLGHWN